jgi:hypothetical protein
LFFWFYQAKDTGVNQAAIFKGITFLPSNINKLYKGHKHAKHRECKCKYTDKSFFYIGG